MTKRGRAPTDAVGSAAGTGTASAVGAAIAETIGTATVVNEDQILARQRAKNRKLAADSRRLNAQFPREVRDAIDARTGVGASKLARWLQDHHKLAPLVAHPNGEAMTPDGLAKKIRRYRRKK